MSKPFTVNVSRFDPYKTFRFLVYFGTSTTPVAGVSKISAIKRSAVVSGSRSGGALTVFIRTMSIVLLSMPPLLTSLLLVFIAALGFVAEFVHRSQAAP